MPPPGYEPFLRAICADPEDDTVRLVYADWLDENGDSERAEFIRLQVAQALKPDTYDSGTWRASELAGANCGSWGGELPALKGIIWGRTFRRGFIESINAQSGKWLVAHHESIFTASPVQSITIDNAGQGTLEKVLRLPFWDHITVLELTSCRIVRDCFRVVSHCPALTKLRVLRFYRSVHPGIVVTDDEAQELVDTPHLPALKEVHICGSVSLRTLTILQSRYETVRYWGTPI